LIPTSQELFRHFNLSLTQEVSEINFYSTRKNWGISQALEGCDRMPSPWINCQLGGVSLHSIGLIGRNKMIWPKFIDLSLIGYQDILPCQESKQSNYPEIHRIISQDLLRSRFFTSDWQKFLFYCCSINGSISSYGHIFSGGRLVRGLTILCATLPMIETLPSIFVRKSQGREEVIAQACKRNMIFRLSNDP
jgi:hypothetical protein